MPLTGCIQTHTLSLCGGLPTPALTCARWGVHLQNHVPDRGFGLGGGDIWFCIATSLVMCLHVTLQTQAYGAEKVFEPAAASPCSSLCMQ